MQSPILILLSGLPGTGKSTVARALADALAPRPVTAFSTDAIRKAIFRTPLYGPAESHYIYIVTRQRIMAALRAGQSAIFDGTNLTADSRAWAVWAAERCASRLLIVAVELDAAIVRERLEARHAAGHDASDAGWAVYQFLQAEREPIIEPHRVVHTDARLAADLLSVISELTRSAA